MTYYLHADARTLTAKAAYAPYNAEEEAKETPAYKAEVSIRVYCLRPTLALCTPERVTGFLISPNTSFVSDHGVESSSYEGAAQQHHCSEALVATPTLMLGTLLRVLLPQDVSLIFLARRHLSDLKY